MRKKPAQKAHFAVLRNGKCGGFEQYIEKKDQSIGKNKILTQSEIYPLMYIFGAGSC